MRFEIFRRYDKYCKQAGKRQEQNETEKGEGHFRSVTEVIPERGEESGDKEKRVSLYKARLEGTGRRRENTDGMRTESNGAIDNPLINPTQNERKPVSQPRCAFRPAIDDSSVQR